MLDTHALCCALAQIAAQHRIAVSATPRKILDRIFNASIDSLRKNQKVLRQRIYSAEKIKTLSFRGTPRAEESLLLFAITPRGIPHSVRNDDQRLFPLSVKPRSSVTTASITDQLGPVVNARVIKVLCSSSCALAEPVAGLALAERFTERTGIP